MKNANILITGANGFTGRHACRHFHGKGMRITALARNVVDSGAPHVEWKKCDLTDKDQVYAVVRETMPDYVLHLAGRNSVPESWLDPVSYMEANFVSTLYLLDALREIKRDCPILVVGSALGSSLSTNSSALHPYALSKWFQVIASQEWGRFYKQRILIAQPSNLIGPGHSNGICGLLAKAVTDLERGKDVPPFSFTSLLEQRDFLDVRDAVNAYESILFHGVSGEIYQLGSGSVRTLAAALACFQAMTTIKLQIQVKHRPLPFVPEPVDNGKMSAFDWKPMIPFERSLQDMLTFFREQQ
ncbi:NAD(P)-dependent oxidoreductase [Paenibacillus sp. V4I7]|uniref:NAD-dependent epimerase/dehydratase family protein n=1 Tax=Paenibacillus sp. V4I7 TaxID=3042307 RepID=UPI002781FEA9|nr:NAD-dependent epimerase/dehydratase family protein [Paenibacillus sp. V4I7]MDQ0901557.1 nucleoside-diphosphate-sugar epimerase [Paenibacillus sp. V4I7]